MSVKRQEIHVCDVCQDEAAVLVSSERSEFNTFQMPPGWMLVSHRVGAVVTAAEVCIACIREKTLRDVFPLHPIDNRYIDPYMQCNACKKAAHAGPCETP